jgi:hypothetical protein
MSDSNEPKGLDAALAEAVIAAKEPDPAPTPAEEAAVAAIAEGQLKLELSEDAKKVLCNLSDKQINFLNQQIKDAISNVAKKRDNPNTFGDENCDYDNTVRCVGDISKKETHYEITSAMIEALVAKAALEKQPKAPAGIDSYTGEDYVGPFKAAQCPAPTGKPSVTGHAK